MKPRIVVIVGPTASGKTGLACDLAERLGAEIVSADSQQCYRGLDVATAKPTAHERARARHHLLDVAEPEDQLDAARFVELADAAIADLHARGKHAIVAGGTGLWIRILLKGLLDAPGADPEFRAGLRAAMDREGVPALHARLREVDPEAAAQILVNDRVRIERALEVQHATGRPMSALQREHGFAEARYDALTLFLDPPRDLLVERIERRAKGFFEGPALFDETRALLARIERIPAAARALKIIGYGETAEALRTGDIAHAIERVAARTRQYSKRQRTWFRRDAEPVPWPPDPAQLSERAKGFYDAPRL